MKLLKGRKFESKEMKNFTCYNFDLDKQNLQKTGEKALKIYNGKFLSHSKDYIILGINKGVVILKFDPLVKPDIVHFEDEKVPTFLCLKPCDIAKGSPSLFLKEFSLEGVSVS